MKNKEVKIKDILRRANEQFAVLKLPQNEVTAKLWQQIEAPVIDFEKNRYNISKSLFKLNLFRFAKVGLIALIIILLVGAGVSYAADSAVPGDWLYSLDRKLEDVQLALIWNQEKLSQKKIRQLQERTKEWQLLKNKKGNGQNFKNQETVGSTNQKNVIWRENALRGNCFSTAPP